MTSILPQDVTKAGKLKTVWLEGCIVRIRERKFQPQDSLSQDSKSNKRGKGAKKSGKQGGSLMKNSKGPRECLELHICGGATPAEVMMAEIWHEPLRKAVRPKAEVGTGIRFKNALIKAHNDKTRPWTTSTLDFFAEVPEGGLKKDMRVICMSGLVSWVSFICRA